MGNLNLKEVAILAAGILILADRGVSWLAILGMGLLAVGANRIARNI